MAREAVPDERTRRLLLRKALRGGRINGKRRIHQRDLAAATGLPATAVSRALSGQTELTRERYQQLRRAIATLVEGGSPSPARTGK